MNRTTGNKKSFIYRIFAFVLSVMVVISCSPVEAMAAEIEEYLDNMLEYQQIEAFISDDGTEKVALDGEMPVDAEVCAEPVENSESSSVCSYDITISKNGEEFQPESDNPINVEIKNVLIGAAVDAEYELQLWHIHDDGTREQVEDFTVDGDTISFAAYGFSVYEVISENNPPLRTYEFYRGGNAYEFTLDSGDTDWKQTVRSGEKLTVPQLPADSVGDAVGPTFIGWFETADGETPSSDEPFDFSVAPTFTTSSVQKLMAVYSYCAYVIFHEQYDSRKGVSPIIATRRGEKASENSKTTIQIGDMKVSYDSSIDTVDGEEQASQKVFVGWSRTKVEKAGTLVSNSGEIAEIIEEDSLSTSENVDLYPIFKEIHWITFDSDGGSFISPEYYYPTDTVTQLPVPTKTGYTFAGWYDESGEQVSDGIGKVLNGGRTFEEDIQLKAHWTAANTSYTIVIWKQQATDEVNGEKHYDYSESISMSAKSGTTVSVPTKATLEKKLKENYTGFFQGDVDVSKEVNGDGSTVLNVYYDRNVHTVKFYPDTNYTNSIHEFSALYGANIYDKFYGFVVKDVYPDGHIRWKAKETSIFSDTFIAIQIMPDSDLNLGYSTPQSRDERYYDFYVEALPDDTTSKKKTFKEFSNKEYVLRINFPHTYGYYTSAEDFWELEGFTKDKSIWSDEKNTLDNADNLTAGKTYYFIYDRNIYDLSFFGLNDSDKLATISIPYEDEIQKHVIPDPESQKEGYYFAGWYADPSCSKRVFFKTPTQAEIDSTKDENGVPHYQVYETMPANNLAFYAKWKPITYEVTYDPNGGELWITNNGKKEYMPTTLFVPYGSTSIVDYDENYAHREYVPSASGGYFYHFEQYDKNDPSKGGKAYYTQDIGEATDLSKTYKQDDDVYRFADWYEVDEEGNEEIYNFNQAITHDTHLVLHWKELATFYIEYDPGDGKIDHKDTNDEQFITLDESNYADHAKVIVTRTIEKVEGQNFIGWKVRNDDSGTIYFPGQSFEFKSEFAESRIEDGVEKNYIVLDAVYEEIGTAKLIYDANDGTMESGKDLGIVYKEYNTEYSSGANPTVVSYKDNTGTIINIPNNSYIKLADAEGLSFIPEGKTESYVFTGWNTKPDGSGDHFDAEDLCVVNKEEPLTLYAEWKVNVYFNKKRETAKWGDANKWTKENYELKDGEQHKTIFYNSVLPKPTDIPIITDKDALADKLFFRYWTEDSSDIINPKPFDFSQPITEDTRLYAYYSKITADMYVVDATLTTPKYVDEESTWYSKNGHLIVFENTAPFDLLTETDPNTMVTKQNGYTYAFAYIGDTPVSKDGELPKPNVSEANKLQSLRYDAESGEILYKLADSDTEYVFPPTGKSIFLVYYTHPKNLDIEYKVVDANGRMSNATVSNSAPKTASINNNGELQTYSMNASIKPLNYTSNYPYASYAIGKKDAYSLADMYYITDKANDIKVRDSWKGIEYSADGKTWYSAGDDVKLYVIYYAEQPVIVNLREKTYGSAEDMDEEFTYHVTVEEITVIEKYTEKGSVTRKNAYYDWGIVSFTTDGKSKPTITTETSTIYDSDNEMEDIKLSNNQNLSYSLYNTAPNITYLNQKETISKDNKTKTQEHDVIKTTKYQKITIVQTHKENYEDYHTENGGNPINNLTYTFSSDTSQNTQDVLYVNTHTPMPIELHVAVANGGVITDRDSDLRSGNKDNYMLKVDNGKESTYKDDSYNEGDGALNGFVGTINKDASKYSFAGVYYVTKNQNGDITDMVRVNKVEYGSVGDNLEAYVNDDKTLIIDSSHQLYYLYYPPVKIQYILKDKTGIEAIKRNGEPVILNGEEIANGVSLPLTDQPYTISGAAGSDYIYPPNLDYIKGSITKNLFLVTPQTAVKDVDENLVMSDSGAIQLKVTDGITYYSFDGSTWEKLSDDNTVYVVYKKFECYALTLTKTVFESSTDEKFTLTISSDKLENGAVYTLSDGNTVTVENGVISVQLAHGESIDILDLPKGEYTVTESGLPNNCEMSAKLDGRSIETENDSFSIYLNKDRTADIENTIHPFPPTGYMDESLPYMIMTAFLVLVSGIIIINHRRRKEVENVENI